MFEGKGRWSVSRMLAGILFFVAFAVANRAAAQQEDAETQARTFFAAGEYKEALDIYAQLYVQTLHPTYLRNIGRCHQNLGEPDKAISSFREYLRKAGNLDAKQKAEVEGFISEMEDLKHERERQEAPSAPASVGQSGAPAAALMPGPPKPAVSTGEPQPPSLVLSAIERPPEHRGTTPLYERWWVWTALGAVAVGGLVTVLVLSRSTSPSAMTDLGTQDAHPTAN